MSSGSATPRCTFRVQGLRFRADTRHRTPAQELLLILEEHWERNPALHSVPIYQASGLAQKAMMVYQTYIEMMNDAIKAAFQAGAQCPWAACLHWVYKHTCAPMTEPFW